MPLVLNNFLFFLIIEDLIAIKVPDNNYQLILFFIKVGNSFQNRSKKHSNLRLIEEKKFLISKLCRERI